MRMAGVAEMAGIRVAVSGAAGKMGIEVVRAILGARDMQLAAAVGGTNHIGEDAAVLAGSKPSGILIEKDLPAIFANKDQKIDVVVDFTKPNAVMSNIKAALEGRAAVIVGTTGITSVDLDQIREWSLHYQNPVLVAPNFAVGAVLMMHCAAFAAQYMNEVEIIELHHDQKKDAPSGTAIKTAEMVLAAKERRQTIGSTSTPASASMPAPASAPASASVSAPVGSEKIGGVRGGELGGIHLHSIRLPGLIAHQEVIFGDLGQTLTIRHDSTSRESFMPGVLLAIRKIRDHHGLIYGLDKIMGLPEPG